MRTAEIEVAATGQRILLYERPGDHETVVFESTLPPGADGLGTSRRDQEQRFVVLGGTVSFVVDEGAEIELARGGRLTVPRGSMCSYRNAGTEPALLVGQVRPTLDFELRARAAAAR
jgi:mannose-6-phosphate isomerase-like protein (cupin superfamily)